MADAAPITANAYFDDLFSRAFDKAPFAALCTLLRVDGVTFWDPFEESRAAFDDYNWMLRAVQKERGPTAGLRVALLMYCQAVEMDAAHELLFNLLRTVCGHPYTIGSLDHLWRRNRKKGVSLPPSATTAFAAIRKLANEAGEWQLVQLIDEFFNDGSRNAFSHSDYVFTDTSFRRSGGELSLDELRTKIDKCFTFFSGLLNLQRAWLLGLSRGRRFHKWPNYEVLELLSSDEDGVYGFNVHFSNGSRATFTRRGGKVEALNLVFEKDGTVNFMVGLLDALEPVYKINGVPVVDWDYPLGRRTQEA